MSTEAPGEADDRTLVSRAQSGDRGAFDKLVRKYHGRVLKLTMRYTHDPADAEDAAQEAFMKAYRGVQHFRRECSFYTWLYRISINSAKNMVAVRKRNTALFRSDAADEPDGMRATEMRDSATPENALLTEEICRIVTSAVNSLPKEQRRAVVLRELERKSYETIAEMMCCPIGTVRSRIYRAREVIDRRLKNVFAEGIGRDHTSGYRRPAN
ncbi:MAG TPA: sigma-70 family RNA polymerase sigma factor [Steroidobacteraceae bacterium]|nr:sigma-70 family RNA polymerase sigma factor [Steroidobacteraceae bacterium]